MSSQTRYIVKASAEPIGVDEFQEGLAVCFRDIAQHPNNIGILTRTPIGIIERGSWYATIGGISYSFTNTGLCIQDGTKLLYKPLYVSGGDLNVSKENFTRSIDEDEHIVYTTIVNMLPKDNFAMAAMQALIQRYKGDPLSIPDGAISAIAAKAYLFGQAMFFQASMAREVDAKVDPYAQIEIDPDTLTEDTDKILYNMLNVMKGITEPEAPEPDPTPEEQEEQQSEE